MGAMALRRRNRIAPIAGALGADKRRRGGRARAAPARYRRLLLIYVRRVSFLMSP